MEPSEERVRSNIQALPSILNDIISAGGCTIQSFSHINNTGKRYKKLKGNGDMKRKPQKRDRKSTMTIRPCHPDLQPALDLLLSGTVTDASLIEVMDGMTAAATQVTTRAARGDDPDAPDNDDLPDECLTHEFSCE